MAVPLGSAGGPGPHEAPRAGAANLVQPRVAHRLCAVGVVAALAGQTAGTSLSRRTRPAPTGGYHDRGT